MPGTTTSGFGEPDDYQAALRRNSDLNLLVTGRGEFRAQLTRISLPHIHLLAGEEDLSRIAFIRLPERMVRVSLPVRRATQLFWNGIPSRPDEIVAHYGGQCWYERTEGPSEWQTISLSTDDLVKYGRVIIGATFAAPPGGCQWRPPPGALRSLARLYNDAIRVNKIRPRAATEATSAHGLEQQVLLALIECMDNENAVACDATSYRHAGIMSQFEEFVYANPGQRYSMHEISAMLGVSDRTLLSCCKVHLGMGPLRYLRLRRMQLVRRALRDGEPGMTSVSEVAGRYGFEQLGRFARDYRAQFGELPSVTLLYKVDGWSCGC
jgi:AraC-like DNA-binding protein